VNPVKELLLGIGLGLGAGVSPGPLLALVLTNTLKRGFGAGLRVAVAPVITDAPIVLATLLAVDALPGAAVRALGGAGGVYLLWLGASTLASARSTTLDDARGAGTRGDLWQGVVANILNPHPWLFWLSVGAPILSTTWGRAPGRGVAFLVGFYGLLLGSKVVLAGMVAVARRRMVERWYRLALAVAGVLLSAAGALLLWDAAAGGSRFT
jgi:threonine/homoserine/homoserine lactone efflux protein